ncbi:MAG: restriction endonuclease subunit S [Micrococcaceae bacterium]
MIEKKKQQEEIVQPDLRFKGYTEAWLPQKFSEVSDVVRGASPRPISDAKWFSNNSDVGWLRIADVTEQNGRIHRLTQKLSVLGQQKTRVLYDPHLLLSIAATVGKPLINYVKTGVHDGFLIFLNPKFNIDFMFQQLELHKDIWRKYGQPGSQVNLNSNIVKNHKIFIPLLSEQEKISEFFKKIDSLIAKHTQKLELLKKLKKGYLQKIFSQELRFRGFTDSWQEHRFQEIFNYERPDKYIVSDTNYVKNGVPVLTANKSFTLGYTQEKDFYEKVPCIIFDDFTLDSKYVDFPFKVKSSALKILNVKDSYDIRFAFELLNITRIPKEGHSRHYISIVQKKKIFSPKTLEQGEIGNFCNTIYNLLTMNSKKLDTLKQTKRAYLQKMFI